MILNDKSKKTVSQVIEFRLTVSPCLVQSLDVVSDPIGPQVYILDTPSITFGPYAFAQTPNCGYEMTESIDNLPPEPFVVRNPATNLFTVARTSDESAIGVF